MQVTLGQYSNLYKNFTPRSDNLFHSYRDLSFCTTINWDPLRVKLLGKLAAEFLLSLSPFNLWLGLFPAPPNAWLPFGPDLSCPTPDTICLFGCLDAVVITIQHKSHPQGTVNGLKASCQYKWCEKDGDKEEFWFAGGLEILVSRHHSCCCHPTACVHLATLVLVDCGSHLQGCYPDQ